MSTSSQRINAKLTYLNAIEREQKIESCISCNKKYYVSRIRKQIGWYKCPVCCKK